MRSRLIRRATAVRMRELLIAVGALAFFIRLPYIVGPSPGTIASDSGVYLGMAHDLIHGHGFATGTELRTPAYAILLAALSAFPGSTATAAVVSQHLLGVGVAVLSTWAAWRFFGRGAALVTGAVVALSPVLVDLEGWVLPDFLVGVCVLAGALLLARAVEGERPASRWIIAAGITLGICALVKPVGQSLMVLAIVPLLVTPRLPVVALRSGLLLAVTFFLTVSPWLIRNAVEYGDFRMSVQDGPALWLREFDWDKRPIPTTTADDRLGKLLFTKTVGRSQYTAPTNTYEYVAAELETNYGYSERTAMALQRRVAIEAIRDDPSAYLRGTVSVARKLAWFTHELYPARFGINAMVERKPPRLPTGPSSKAFGLAQRLMHLWWVLSLALFSALLLPFVGRRQRAASLSLGIAWLAITFATSATTWPDPRYAAEVVPLIWIVGSAGVALVVRGLADALHHGRTRP
jgi:4-amino-4-deoxy-L-arabinose transferase-like glycosyltransferase